MSVTQRRPQSLRTQPATIEDLTEIYRELMQLPVMQDRLYHKFWAQTILSGPPLAPLNRVETCWVGSAVHVVLRRSWIDYRPGRSRPAAALSGYRARVSATGQVFLGGREGCSFSYDFSQEPRAGEGGHVLNPNRPAALEVYHAGLLLQSELREVVEPEPDADTAQVAGRLSTRLVVPQFWAVFRADGRRPAPLVPVQEGTIATALDALAHPENYHLPCLQAPADGRLQEIERTDAGMRLHLILVDGQTAELPLPPTALLEVGVAPGLYFRAGARLACLATPRTYPVWEKVMELLGADWAYCLLQEAVQSTDWLAAGQVRRRLEHCSPADLQMTELLLEDNRELFRRGTPIAQALPVQVERKRQLGHTYEVDFSTIPFRWANGIRG